MIRARKRLYRYGLVNPGLENVMRKMRILIMTMLVLVACSCQELSYFQDLFPELAEVLGTPGIPGDQGSGEVPTETETPLPPVDLAYGDNISETLSSGRGDLWTFAGVAGDVVTISMTSGEFDTFLALFRPSGDYLVCDDDSGVEFNSAIIDFPLPDSGVYTINAMGLVPDRVGSYSLTISQTSNGTIHIPPGGGSLSIGDSITDYLDVWTGDAWTFDGNAGDVISAGSRSDEFDTVLTIYGPDLHRVAWDDDSLGEYNSLISGLTLPSSGRYMIIVRSFSDAGIGAYELATAPGTSIPGWEPALVAADEVIEFGETVQGELTTVHGEQWVFNGSEGDSIKLSVTSSQFDSLISLFGPDGEYLTCDDDGGTGSNAMIDGFSLPQSGTYFVDVLSYGAGATGTYSLSLELTSSGAVPSSVNSEVIAYGSTVNQTLGAWVGDEWLFEGVAGDVITISMVSEDFDTFLDLYDPFLFRVAMDDDGGSGSNSQISSVELPISGVYTIVARSFGPLQGGDYSLSLLN
jgi:hypothetical protein